MVEIKINMEKKYVWFLTLVIVAVGFVIAYGGNNPQEMGHTLGEVQGIDTNNNNIVDNAEKLGNNLPEAFVSTTCRVSTVNSGPASREARAVCETNEVLMGGGCTPFGVTGIRVTRPEMPGGQAPFWYCLFVDPNSSAHALCCRKG